MHGIGAALMPRAYSPPTARKPRILIYVEPAVFRSDPLGLANWMVAIDRWTRAGSDEMNVHLVSSSALLERAKADYASRTSIDPEAVIEPFGGNNVRYMRDVCGDTFKNDALRGSLLLAREQVEPDIVVSWTPNAYLPMVFENAAVVYTENGPLPRNGCVLTKYLDPFGHQFGSAFDRLSSPIWLDDTQDVACKWIDCWISAIRSQTKGIEIREWIATLPKESPRTLVALQPQDSLSYEGIGPDCSPLDYLSLVAAQAKPDTIIIPQLHPAQPAPSDVEWQQISQRLPSIVIPPARLLQGCSEHLAEYVDEIATISSNVALIAAILGKSLRVDGRSKYSALRTAPCEMPRRRPDLVAFTLEHYCDPSTDWDKPGFFARRLQTLASNPEALFSPVRLSQERAQRF